MTGDELERLLEQAFDAQAQAAVGEGAAPPAPRFDQARPARRRLAMLAPIAAAAAVIAVLVLVLALTRSPSGQHKDSAQRPGAVAVHLTLGNHDGAVYGVGMPVIASFSKKITDARALQAATKVSVNGKTVDGAWFFEASAAGHGPVEGHLRMQHYWPAHAHVHVAIAAKGVAAGTGMAFGNSVSLDFRTGARTVSVVDDATHRMSVTSDGKQIGTFPVSLGARNTPTASGTKVVMGMGASICMRGPGYYECGIKYTQRLTYSGEYLHAAPWNMVNIARGVDSSNGCTNLLPADAKQLYQLARVGDVVQYPNASGRPMTMGGGYGDWNVPWRVWQRGGLAPTR